MKESRGSEKQNLIRVNSSGCGVGVLGVNIIVVSSSGCVGCKHYNGGCGVGVLGVFQRWKQRTREGIEDRQTLDIKPRPSFPFLPFFSLLSNHSFYSLPPFFFHSPSHSFTSFSPNLTVFVPSFPSLFLYSSSVPFPHFSLLLPSTFLPYLLTISLLLYSHILHQCFQSFLPSIFLFLPPSHRLCEKEQ